MTSARPTALPRLVKGLIYLLVAGLVAALVWSQLPRVAYSTDLTRIGQGRPAMVLAYDIKSMGGMEVMAMMDALHPAFDDRIDFLVAPLGAPHGQAFGERHGAVNGTVVFFSAAGAAVGTLHFPFEATVLQQALEGMVGPPRPGR
jgi:hypothetical protein